jgi:hypothetical protein
MRVYILSAYLSLLNHLANINSPDAQLQLFIAQWLLYVPPALTLKTRHAAHSKFICFIISLPSPVL